MASNMVELSNNLPKGCARYEAGCFCNSCCARELATKDLLPLVEKEVDALFKEREVIRKELRARGGQESGPLTAKMGDLSVVRIIDTPLMKEDPSLNEAESE